MYKIYFYKDRKGNYPVFDYIKKLKTKNDKDSRIKSSKINDYIQALSVYGTQIGEPYLNILKVKFGNFAHCATEFYLPPGLITVLCYCILL